MVGLWKEFLAHAQGQDLIEYTLLVAFIALASAALFVSAGDGVNGVSDHGSEVLHSANRALRSHESE